MKKIFPYNEMSSSVSCICGNKMKLRLVVIKPTYKRCYQCHRAREAARGHFIDAQPRKKRIVKGLPVKGFEMTWDKTLLDELGRGST